MRALTVLPMMLIFALATPTVEAATAWGLGSDTLRHISPELVGSVPAASAKGWAKLQQLRVDRYAAADQITTDLMHHLGLPHEEGTRKRVATLVGHVLGTDTRAGYLPATADIHTLDQLLRQQTAVVQQALAAWLPEAAYSRYLALLDRLKLVAS